MSITEHIAASLGRDPWYRCPAPDLTSRAKAGARVQVRFPVSCSYNGGTVVDGKWYAGYMVPEPIVPSGFKLVGLGVGLELNAHPPHCTMLLVPDDTQRKDDQ